MALIELRDYAHAPTGRGKGLKRFSFSMSQGDGYAIRADRIDDAHLFMRALAALEPPEEGDYFFGGERVDFTDYRKVLSVRKRIGYICADAALISNRTLRTNLLLARYYSENRLQLELGDDVLSLCRSAGIEDKLDLRPAQVASEDARAAIFIRELTKGAEAFLLEQVDVFLTELRSEMLPEISRIIREAGRPYIFYALESEFTRQMTKREVTIRDGVVTVA